MNNQYNIDITQIIKDQQKHILETVRNQNKQILNILFLFKNELESDNFDWSGNLYQSVVNHIKWLKEKVIVLRNMSSLCESRAEVFNLECYQQFLYFAHIKTQLQNQIQNLSNENKKQNLLQSLDEANQIVKMNKKFQYKKIQGFSIEQSACCSSIEFNTNSTILFVGLGGKIKMFGFNIQKKLVFFFNGCDYNSDLKSLIWMKQSESLVLGSSKHQIIIWNFNQKEFFTKNQIMDSCQNTMFCLIANYKENLLVSGSEDKTIKFIKKVNSNWILEQILDAQQQVYSLSVNSSSDKVIATGNERNIQVIELQYDGQWIITQTINTKSYDFKLHFLSDNQFVIQQEGKGLLQIFNYEYEQKQFLFTQEIKVERSYSFTYYFLLIQYVNSKKLLVCQFSQFLNFYEMDLNGSYQYQYSIDFNTDNIIGKLTQDGQYLVTCSEESFDFPSINIKEIVIRKQKYLK